MMYFKAVKLTDKSRVIGKDKVVVQDIRISPLVSEFLIEQRNESLFNVASPDVKAGCEELEELQAVLKKVELKEKVKPSHDVSPRRSERLKQLINDK
jgi:hypothetical protein